MKDDVTREKWILAEQMATAVNCLNAPFCDGGPAENPQWQNDVARHLAKQCGKMALEDAIAVLEQAYEITVAQTLHIPERF